MFEEMREAFDLVEVETTPVGNMPVVIDATVEPTPEDLADKSDRDLARQTYRDMLAKSDRMLDALVSIADGTEHPRAFEVAANLVKTIADVAGKLDEAASRKLVAKTDDKAGNVTNVNHNNLFVGSSEDLMKMIREGKK